LYIKNCIKFKTLSDLNHPDFEALWTWLRPLRLPRGIPCLVVGTIYHPPSANDQNMLNHLSTTLTSIEGQYPGCGIYLCGDFNQLNIQRLKRQFRLKQLVDKPTRGDCTLDLIITNMSNLYDAQSVQILPPFGLSDHSVVVLRPKIRATRDCPSRKLISRRDLRTSRKLELGRYLCNIDWSFVDLAEDCSSKLEFLTQMIINGLDTIMPVKQSHIHTNDLP